MKIYFMKTLIWLSLNVVLLLQRPGSAAKDIFIRKHSGRLKSLEPYISSTNAINQSTQDSEPEKPKLSNENKRFHDEDKMSLVEVAASPAKMKPKPSGSNNQLAVVAAAGPGSTNGDDTMSEVSYMQSDRTRVSDLSSQVNCRKMIIKDKNRKTTEPQKYPNCNKNTPSTACRNQKSSAYCNNNANCNNNRVPVYLRNNLKQPQTQSRSNLAQANPNKKPTPPNNTILKNQQILANNNKNVTGQVASRSSLNFNVLKSAKSNPNLNLAAKNAPIYNPTNGVKNEIVANDNDKLNPKTEAMSPVSNSSSNLITHTPVEILKIDSARLIEKNKKPLIVNTSPLNHIQEITFNGSERFDESFSSNIAQTNSTNGVLNMPTNSDVLKKLDMYSNKLNLYETLNNANNNTESYAYNKPSSAASVFSNNHSQTNVRNVGAPSEPLVYQLFEDLPQPFASNNKKQEGNNKLVGQAKASANSKKNAPKAKNVKSVVTRSKSLVGKSSANGKGRVKTTTKSSKKKTAQQSESNKIEVKQDENLNTSELVTATGDNTALIREIDKLFDGNYENEDFEKEDASSIETATNSPDSSDDEEDSFDQSHNASTNNLDLSKSMAKSDGDLYNKSIISTIDLKPDDPKQPNQKRDSEASTARLDFVRSFEDKVFAIYNKYDNLLSMQADRMANDASKSSQEAAKYSELSKQKIQFSTEMERELNENFNFEEISSNPDLVKRFKQLYDLVKKNSNSSESGSEKAQDQTVSSKSSNSLTDKRPPLPATIPKLTVNQEKVKSESVTNPTGIREIFSIVNSFSRTLSFNNQNFEDYKKSSHRSGSDLNERTLTRDENIYHIPPSLSDKINTIVTPLLKTGESDAESTLTSDKKPRHFANFVNEQEKLKEFEINPKLKVSKVNKLDSVGNESTSSNSIDIDHNSLNYNYDQKYKYDQSKNPAVRMIIFLYSLYKPKNTFYELIFIKFQIIPDDFDNDLKFTWKRGNLLGKGAFGLVYQALLGSGEIVAVKQIEMEETDPEKARREYENVREEVKILRELEHINIVKFWETTLELNMVSIFMEFIPGGTIETLIKTYGSFEESLVKNFTHQICNGVRYIHSKNVVHR
jgi:hypothetical protein